MAQSAARGRVVGDYLVGRQIGSGSFSLVWHARHRVHGTEVAIKEIATDKLSKKLQESLLSEIHILKRISNPNIIRLLDIIEAPGKIHLVLEYCRGRDLFMYINRHGRVPEEIAKHFMQQLATGLKVLRDNNLIHRDLKPQNLLLLTDDVRPVLKIADFGFARSLEPRNLAETVCGSPLYMAPEIMENQKYDAKADLWSVGAILYQLVTGKTPFTGNDQRQLLHNIQKSKGLQFPPESNDLSSDCKDLCQKLLRRNPVERLTFEEFFNHSFLSQKQPDSSLRSSKFSRSMDSFPMSESEPAKNTEESVHDDFFPFFLDDDCNGSVRSPSVSNRRTSTQLIKGFTDPKIDKRELPAAAFSYIDQNARDSSSSNMKMENDSFGPDTHRNSDGKPNYPLLDQRPMNTRLTVGDSMELSDGYVLVPEHPLDGSSSSLSASKMSQFPFKSESPPQASHEVAFPSSVPVPIGIVSRGNIFRTGSIGNPTVAQGTSFESMDNVDAFEKPSSHCMMRLSSLQQFASIIKQVMKEKMDKRAHLEAFSIQLVILAIWKQALHICHTEAASAMEGSPSAVTTRLRSSCDKKHCSSSLEVCTDAFNTLGPESSHIEGEFLREMEHAEELAKVIEPGSTEMPDAMEAIYKSALAFGRHGGVEELLDKRETAESLYSKAVQLLLFLLVEAPSLILNPPFSLTDSDKYRLRHYIDMLKNRQIHLRSGTALHKSEDQQCPT